MEVIIYKLEIVHYQLSEKILEKYSDIILSHMAMTNTYLDILHKVYTNGVVYEFPKFEFKKKTKLTDFITYLENTLSNFNNLKNELSIS